MSIIDLKPRKYDLAKQSEIARLLHECAGYLNTCRRDHHGTDFEGRRFAMEALHELAARYPQESE